MLELPPQWMQWTASTLIFLGTIILLLTGFTVWDIKDPGWAREGHLLPIATTRGDRFFMGLLLTGIYFCLWLVFFGATAAWTVIVAGVLLIAGTISFF
jgi:predicted small integral membrane protein